VQLREVLDLVGRVRRRRRILRLILLVVRRRLVAGSRLVIVSRLLFTGPLSLVVSYRPPGNRPGNEPAPPCPSPETHGKLLPVRSAVIDGG